MSYINSGHPHTGPPPPPGYVRSAGVTNYGDYAGIGATGVRTSNIVTGGLVGGQVVSGRTIGGSIAQGALGGTRIVGVGNGAIVGGYGGLTTTTTGLATSGLVSPAPIYNRAVVEEIPTESRIEYVPYQKRQIIYEQVERVESIPVQRVITEYEEVVRQQTVPVQRVIQDYYAVEYQVEYIPNVVQQTIVEYVQQEHITERVQYTPIETQIIHYPEAQLAISGAYINNGATNYVSTGVVPAATTYVGGAGLAGVRTSQYATSVPAAQTTTYVTETTGPVTSYGNSYGIAGGAGGYSVAGGYNGSLATRSVAAYGGSSLGGSYTVGGPTSTATYVTGGAPIASSGYIAGTIPATYY